MFNLGLSLMGRLSGSLATYMQLGMNSNWVSTWDTPEYFVNIARQLGSWVNKTNSADLTFTQYRGALVTGLSATDEYRAYITDSGNTLPAGTYTVRWTGDGEVAIGNFDTATTFAPWDSTGSFTFTLSSGNFHALWFKGVSLDSIEIIMPGEVANYDAGNEWNPAYLSYILATGSKVMRSMNWVVASESTESAWTDRATTSSISYQKSVPIEVMADFTARTGIELWWNIPTRADNNYIEQSGILWDTVYPSGKILYIEFGNEIWNTGLPWGDGTAWIKYINHTRYTATADATTDVFTLAGHGLTTGDTVVSFKHNDDYFSDVDLNWKISNGTETQADVIDANTFKLKRLGVVADIVIGHTKLLFIKTADAGLADLDANYTLRNEQAWDELEKNMPRSRMHYDLGSWFTSTATTSDRVTALVDNTRADSVSVAPYYSSSIFATNTILDTTVMTPAIYTKYETGAVVYFGLYLAADTPTFTDIKSGIGAIASELITVTATRTTYTSGTQITGLTDTTAYKAHYVFHDKYGYESALVESYTQPSIATELKQINSYADQAARDRFEVQIRGEGITNHLAVSQGIPINCYEGGTSFEADAPAEVDAWIREYFLTTEYQAVVTEYLYTLAGAGTKLFLWYKDASETVYGLTSSFADKALDGRYRSFSGFSGSVPVVALPTLTPVQTDLTTQPTTPIVILDVSTTATGEGALTYSIISGNDEGIFSIDSSTGELSIVDDSTVAWANANSYSLIIKLFDGFKSVMGDYIVTLTEATPELSLNGATSFLSIANTTLAADDTVTVVYSSTDTDASIIGSSVLTKLLGRWATSLNKRSGCTCTFDGVDLGYDGDVSAYLDGSLHTYVATVTTGFNVELFGKRDNGTEFLSGVIKSVSINKGGLVTTWDINTGTLDPIVPTIDENSIGNMTINNAVLGDWA